MILKDENLKEIEQRQKKVDRLDLFVLCLTAAAFTLILCLFTNILFMLW